jgi:predicted Zn-dependent peptidase
MTPITRVTLPNTPTDRPLRRRSTTNASSQTFTTTLQNGLTLVAEAIPGVRSAAFVLLLPAGAVTDPVGQEGMATLIEGLVYRGAGARDVRALSDALDSLGVQRGGGADLEHSAFGGTILADDLESALALYADIIRRPHLPADQQDAERDLALQKLARLKDSPAENLFVHLRREYFTSPHGRTPLGTPEGLTAITPGAAVADHARRYRPAGAILAIAGKVDWPRLQHTVEELFGDWDGEPPPTPAPTTHGESRYLHISQETSQEQIGVAYAAAGLGEPGYPDARMAIEILSGGMAARLFTEVRERRGLVYTVRASHSSLKGSGVVFAYAGTTPERSQETLEVLIAELQRVVEGVTEEEVARARVGLLSALVMQGEASRARAHSLARDTYLLGRVRSLEEIREAFERVTPASIVAHLQERPPANFTVVTLGPRTLTL